MRNFIIPFNSLFLLLLMVSCNTNENRVQQNERRVNLSNTEFSVEDQDLDTATFAGGCFWCTEAYFERIEGVKKVVSGYSGGTTPNPTYEEVSYGRTDYAEAVQVYYDPAMVDYQTLLKVFFATMDPTQLNRQGPDIGEQYRSVVFYHNNHQEELSRNYVEQLRKSGRYDKPIVTEVEPFEKFYIAEDYHQDYYELNPQDPYVRSVARPKVKKLEKEFRALLKPEYK